MTPTTQRAGLAAVPIAGAAAFLAAERHLDGPPILMGVALVIISAITLNATVIFSAGLPFWWRSSGIPVLAVFIATVAWRVGPILEAAGYSPLMNAAEFHRVAGTCAAVWVAWLVCEVVRWFRFRRAARPEETPGNDDMTDTGDDDTDTPNNTPTGTRAGHEWVQTGPHAFTRADIAAARGETPYVRPAATEPEPVEHAAPEPREYRSVHPLGPYVFFPDDPEPDEDDIVGNIARAWPENRHNPRSVLHVADMATLTGFDVDTIRDALETAGLVVEKLKARPVAGGESTGRLGVRWADFEAITTPEGVDV